MASPETTIVAEVRAGEYGDSVTTVEPGGAEFIPLADRHGKPISLFWTWLSPNLEFATLFLGILAVGAWGLGFVPATIAIVAGTALGSVTQGILSARGPELGVAQMIASRIPFGFRGNILPAGLNAVVAGVGWFAVNSVSGALALNALLHLNKLASLLIVVVAQIAVAFVGHNFIHTFEKFALPLLAIAFIIAGSIIAAKSDPSKLVGYSFTKDPSNPYWVHPIAGFTLMFATSFGYAAGWNPYATDYTRYFAPDTSKKAIALWSGLGVFVSCVALEMIGLLSMSLKSDPFGNPSAAFVSNLPGWVGKLTLLAIVIGAISANAINVYSGSMSFLALGIKLHLGLARAATAAVFGVLGTIVAIAGLSDIGKYENFLLVIAYWIGPWLGVVLIDQVLRRGHQVGGFVFDEKHNPNAGWVAMLVATVVSVYLFSNQVQYVGPIAKNVPWLGDITFEAGFVIAALLYFAIFSLEKDNTDEKLVLPS